MNFKKGKGRLPPSSLLPPPSPPLVTRLSIAYKSFGSFGMSTIVKFHEQVCNTPKYLMLLVIFSNDKALYNPLSKYRSLLKVSYKKLHN